MMKKLVMILVAVFLIAGFSGCGLAQYSDAELEEMAKAGDTDAMYDLGLRHHFADKPNLPEAKKWYGMAAKEGHKESNNNLGCIHYNQEDYEVAVRLFYAAAEMYLPEGILNLGICFKDGRGTAQNMEAAREQFEKVKNDFKEAREYLYGSSR